MKLKNFSFPSFTLVFLMVGLPIIYVLREYLPLNIKFIFTYSIVSILLLFSINYNRLLKLKFYTNNLPLIHALIGILLLLFILYAYMTNSIEAYFSKFIYIIIILIIYIMLLTHKTKDLKKIPFYFLIISSFSQLISISFTPINPSYWALHGGSFYVGDTNNSNLISFISLLNIFSIIYFYNKINSFYKLILFIILCISIFLYFISFSKSAIFGFILIFLYFSLFNRKILKFIYNKKTLFILSIILIYIFYFTPLSNILQDMVTDIIRSTNYMIYGGGDSHFNSGAVRFENYKKSFEIFKNINLFYGEGIFLTQTDNAIIQGFTDLGYFMGIYITIIIFIIPTYFIIYSRNLLKKNQNNALGSLYNYSIALYLFNIPNIIFHATPYAISIWLPILLLYKTVPKR